MKPFSICKLELQAVLLASFLRLETGKLLAINIQKPHKWSDSTIVLQLFNSTSKFPVYKANRVSEVLETTTIVEKSICSVATFQHIRAPAEQPLRYWKREFGRENHTFWKLRIDLS